MYLDFRAWVRNVDILRSQKVRDTSVSGHVNIGTQQDSRDWSNNVSNELS